MFNNKKISELNDRIRELEYRLDIRDKRFDLLAMSHGKLVGKFDALCKHMEINIAKDSGYKVTATED